MSHRSLLRETHVATDKPSSGGIGLQLPLPKLQASQVDALYMDGIAHVTALSLARRGFAALAVATVAVFGMHHTAASAQTHYVCTPEAIKAKKEFVVARFSDYLAGKYAKSGNMNGVMQKIWDGQGDCDV